MATNNNPKRDGNVFTDSTSNCVTAVGDDFTGASMAIYLPPSGNTTEGCFNAYVAWTVGGMGVTSATSVEFKYSIAMDATPRQCDLVKLGNDPTTLTPQQLWNQLRNNQALQTANLNGNPVQGNQAVIDDLNLKLQAGSTAWWGFGLRFNPASRDTVPHLLILFAAQAGGYLSPTIIFS